MNPNIKIPSMRPRTPSLSATSDTTTSTCSSTSTSPITTTATSPSQRELPTTASIMPSSHIYHHEDYPSPLTSYPTTFTPYDYQLPPPYHATSTPLLSHHIIEIEDEDLMFDGKPLRMDHEAGVRTCNVDDQRGHTRRGTGRRKRRGGTSGMMDNMGVDTSVGMSMGMGVAAEPWSQWTWSWQWQWCDQREGHFGDEGREGGAMDVGVGSGVAGRSYEQVERGRTRVRAG